MARARARAAVSHTRPPAWSPIKFSTPSPSIPEKAKGEDGRLAETLVTVDLGDEIQFICPIVSKLSEFDRFDSAPDEKGGQQYTVAGYVHLILTKR